MRGNIGALVAIIIEIAERNEAAQQRRSRALRIAKHIGDFHYSCWLLNIVEIFKDFKHAPGRFHSLLLKWKRFTDTGPLRGCTTLHGGCSDIRRCALDSSFERVANRICDAYVAKRRNFHHIHASCSRLLAAQAPLPQTLIKPDGNGGQADDR